MLCLSYGKKNKRLSISSFRLNGIRTQKKKRINFAYLPQIATFVAQTEAPIAQLDRATVF